MSIDSPDPASSADLARLLLHATRAFEREMIERLADVGWNELELRHLTVFRALDPEHGSRATALARDAGVTRQAVGQVVAELESLGFVEQLPDPTDGRAKIVRYTPRGRQGYLTAMAVFTELEREVDQAIGARRVKALKQDLRKLAEIGGG